MNIGEASAASGRTQRMIRHYEAIGLIPPAARRDSGYRDYVQADVNALSFIRRARDLGFPICEIAQLLALWRDRDRASADVKALALGRAADLKVKARALDAMRRSLEHLAENCHGDTRPDCPILEELSRDVSQPYRHERLKWDLLQTSRSRPCGSRKRPPSRLSGDSKRCRHNLGI